MTLCIAIFFVVDEKKTQRRNYWEMLIVVMDSQSWDLVILEPVPADSIILIDVVK